METLTFLILDLSEAVVCLKQLGGKVQGVEARQCNKVAQFSTISGSRYMARWQGKKARQGTRCRDKAMQHASSVVNRFWIKVQGKAKGTRQGKASRYQGKVAR